MERKNNEPVWKYLPYVTLSDIVREAKGYIGAWFGISVVSLVIGGLFEFGQQQIGFSFNSFVSSIVPDWLWPVTIFGALLWFGKGEEIKFTIPVFGIKSWLFFVSLFAGMIFVMKYSEWWVALPFFYGFIFTIAALDTLGLKGKENFEKLNKEATTEP